MILGILQLVLANKLAVMGAGLQSLEQEVSSLEEENKKIKSEIAQSGGLIELSLIATQKGFVKNPPVVNFSTKIPVALK